MQSSDHPYPDLEPVKRIASSLDIHVPTFPVVLSTQRCPTCGLELFEKQQVSPFMQPVVVPEFFSPGHSLNFTQTPESLPERHEFK